MDQFRRGEKNLLVCTNALEEGVDVSELRLSGKPRGWGNVLKTMGDLLG
jgi:hypothetical protein